MLTSKARLSKGRENLLGAVLLSLPGRSSRQHARPRCAPLFCAYLLQKGALSVLERARVSLGTVPVVPPGARQTLPGKAASTAASLACRCERTRRAIVRCRVKVDDGGSPAEAATTPGIPNPPCRNPQAGIPITFLSPRTIPRPRLSFSSLHTMATSEASPHINAVLECGVKLPLYIFFSPPLLDG